MPEGDTIRRLADRITDRFVGQQCVSSTMRDPRVATVSFAGTSLTGADAVGKHLLLHFDDDRTLHSHLLMHGSWDLGRRAQVAEWKRRVELRMDDGWLTAIEVPILDVVPTGRAHEFVDHLGPDLCGSVRPDVDEMTANLRREPDAALATALLDQRNIAGFGNVYAIELPFLAGVSPFRPIAEVDGLETLVDVGTALIRFNATRSGRNTTGRRLHTGATWIYGRGRRPCPWCATQLASATDADTPWGRTSTWCPACQPAIGQARVDGERIERALALHPARRDMTRRG